MNEVEELPRASELKAKLERLSAAEFARAFPQPALHLALRIGGPTRAPESNKSTTERSYERTSVIPPAQNAAIQKYHDRVAFLAKRPGNPFPNMVSVGRALNNDLVFVLSTVSKLHGFFMCEGSSWCFIDHNSRNGSQLNDQALTPNERRPLKDGDRIRLGLELQAVFLTPASLYGRLRALTS